MANQFFISRSLSPSLDDAYAKAKRILKSDSVLAVLVVNITESSPWHGPTRRSVPDDFIERRNWMRDALESQEGDPFHHTLVNGHIWMHDIAIDMHLCKRPQGNAAGDRQLVCFPHQIPMITPNSLLQFVMPAYENPSFPELDAELQRNWEAFINNVAGASGVDLQPVIVQVQWDVVRMQLQTAIRITAHQRFIKWYGTGERRLNEDE